MIFIDTFTTNGTDRKRVSDHMQKLGEWYQLHIQELRQTRFQQIYGQKKKSSHVELNSSEIKHSF